MREQEWARETERDRKKSACVHITEKYRTMFYGVDLVIKCVCVIVVGAAFFLLHSAHSNLYRQNSPFFRYVFLRPCPLTSPIPVLLVLL